jgi:proteasome activator-like protein
VKIVLDGPAKSAHAHRVEDPGRVLRVWALLNSASRELHQAGFPQTAVATLQRQLRANVSELQRSLSPELAGELGRLLSHDDAAPPSLDELRVEYATLLGWAGGLVIAMFDQLEQGSTVTAAASECHKDGSR